MCPDCKKTKLDFSIPDDVYEALLTEATRRRITVDTLIEWILIKYLLDNT